MKLYGAPRPQRSGKSAWGLHTRSSDAPGSLLSLLRLAANMGIGLFNALTRQIHSYTGLYVSRFVEAFEGPARVRQSPRRHGNSDPSGAVLRHGHHEEAEEASLYQLPRGRLRAPRSLQDGGGGGKGLHFHMVVSSVFLVLALAGWGALGWSIVSDKERQTELQREVVRLTAERDREVLLVRSVRSDQAKMEEELAIARKGIASLIEALEQSRSALAVARQEMQILRRQAQPASSVLPGQPSNSR